MQRQLRVTVSPDAAGSSLLDYLARRFTYLSRQAWRAELAVGHLLLNDRSGQPDALLAAGDLLVYLPSVAALAEPPVVLDYGVLYEDEHLLVVDKPAPLPCHPGGRFFSHTLWALLRERQGLARPALVNRLDRETSGIVLVAKTRGAARSCQEQFLAGAVEKEYLALVEGEAEFWEHEAVGWLAPDPASQVRKKVRFHPLPAKAESGGVACVTALRRLVARAGLSLLAVMPRTGRCHQIRATLFALGLPVVGDKLYGLDETLFLRFMEDGLTDADRALLRLERQALHAARLCIRHPESGREMEFRSPAPPAFSRLLPAGAAVGADSPVNLNTHGIAS
ncbi:MAG: RluA family pseudouridine synthase [Thermodesulfobacteriota bacterium]